MKLPVWGEGRWEPINVGNSIGFNLITKVQLPYRTGLAETPASLATPSGGILSRVERNPESSDPVGTVPSLRLGTEGEQSVFFRDSGCLAQAGELGGELISTFVSLAFFPAGFCYQPGGRCGAVGVREAEPGSCSQSQGKTAPCPTSALQTETRKRP